MTLTPLIERAQVIVALGPGGVGKTTTAAALALKAARAGRRTVVCTIDPARRLASSLGVALGSEPTQVAPERFTEAGLEPTTQLYAMMLDASEALDRMLLSTGRDPELTKKLRSHPLYQTMVRELPGMHEYAAISRLYELQQQGGWDLVVLDTPPTTHALDFLDAPRRMIRALESPAMQWLVKPYLRAGHLSLKLLGGGRAYVLRRLARIVGTGLLEQIAEFLVLFETVLDGVHERIDAVSRLLTGSEMRYVIVTSPAPASVQETTELARQLGLRRLRVDALVMNRLHRLASFRTAEPEAIAEELARQPDVSEMAAEDQLRLLEWLSITHRRFQRLAQADQRQLDWLQQQLPECPLTATVPLMAQDVHDLDGLSRIAEYL
ncbi:MAG: ArsA-related P-loop ATPase [bacterium]